MGYTIADVDQAWEDKLGGRSVTDPEEGVVAVSFFQETPDESTVVRWTFPSLSITLSDVVEDDERREGEQEGDRVKSGEDTMVSPPESLMTPVPTPYRLVYQVETWARGHAAVDRQLMFIVKTVLGERATLSADGTAVWAFRTGFSNLDRDEDDVRIYHKMYVYEVLVELADETDVERVKQAIEIRLGFKKGTARPTAGRRLEKHRPSPSETVADQDDLVLDITTTNTG